MTSTRRHDSCEERTQLWLLERQHSEALFHLIAANREHLRQWHPWVDHVNSPAGTEHLISAGLQQLANHRGFMAGIWFDGTLCGTINHLTVDWLNRCTPLSYWLAAAYQGRGIMTTACRAFIQHAFQTWKLNRVTIECGSENLRSRAIAERLGFTLEGTVRSAELIRDRYIDHALYGLLRPEFISRPVSGGSAATLTNQSAGFPNGSLPENTTSPASLALDSSFHNGTFRIPVPIAQAPN